MTPDAEHDTAVAEKPGDAGGLATAAARGPKSLIGWIITSLGTLGSAMFVAVACLIVFEVIMRFVFSRPTSWATEISGFLTIVASFLLFSYTLQEKGHTRVDFVTAHLSPGSILVLEIFTSVLGLVYCAVLTWYGGRMAYSSWGMGELSQTLRIPLWIPQSFLPVGGLLMFVQLLRFLKQDVSQMGRNLHGDPGAAWLKAAFAAAVFAGSLLAAIGLLLVSPILGLLLLFFALLFNGMPVAYAMGLFGTFGLFFLLGGSQALLHVPMTTYTSIDSVVIVAFPLFLLSGTVLEAGKVGPRIFHFANTLVRHLPGGMGIAAIIFCGIFSAMTGSSVAVAAAVSVIALPEMLKRGYSRKTTIGLLAAGGTLGILFPPSIALIMYSAITFESLGDLFLGAVIPGIVLSVMFMAYMVYVGIKDKRIQRDKRASAGEVLQATRESIGGLIVIVIIMGGIYSGLFTPTEAGAVAALYSIFLCTVWYRTLKWQQLRACIMKAGKISAMIILIIASANVAGNLITMTQVTQNLLNLIQSWAVSPWLYMALIIIFLIVLGGPVEAESIMFITCPILFPIIKGIGFDPVWFGIIMVVTGETALISPPEGINLFILQEIGKATAAEVSKGVLPFLVIMALFLILISLFPSMATWLPLAAK
jgi:C4-dicarboxylate transporter DctM subunit